MITEELVDRLVAATAEAKETLRQLHEARRDARTALRELEEKLDNVRDAVIKANNELAEREWRKMMDAIDLEQLGAGLKSSFDQWLKLLEDAQGVLAALQQREEQLLGMISAKKLSRP